MSKSNAVPIALAGLFVLASVTPATAQSLSDFGAPDLGALIGGGDRLHLGVTGMAAYETNVARLSAAQAAVRGLRLDDEIYTPSGTLDFQQHIGNGAAVVNANAGYNVYAHNRQLNRENISAQGMLTQQFRLCQSDVKVNYSRALNQLADATAQEVEETYTQATIGGDITCGRPVGFAPTASVSESWGDNGTSTLSISNSQTFSSSVGVAYRSPSQGTLSLNGVYRDTEFPNNNPSALLTGKGSGYTVRGGSIRYDRRLGARIQSTLSVDYTIVQGDQTPTFRGLTYAADISYRASARLNFRGDFSRQVIPSNLLNSSYRVENDDLVSAQYILGSRLTASLGVSQQVGDEAGGISSSALLQHYDQKSIFSTLTLTLRKVVLALDVRNDHRMTNTVGLNYYDTRASISASAKF